MLKEFKKTNIYWEYFIIRTMKSRKPKLGLLIQATKRYTLILRNQF